MKIKKEYLIILANLFLIIQITGSVFAIINYDQKIYRIDSKVKNNYAAERCSNCYQSYNRIYENLERESDCSYNYEFRNYESYKSEKTKKSIFGNYIKEYSVQIQNNGHTGRYFTVVFELKDKNGFKFTQSITEYIRDGENKKFVYKDIQYERHEILNWSYNIIIEK